MIFQVTSTRSTLISIDCVRKSGDRLPRQQQPVSLEPAPLTPVEQGELQPVTPGVDGATVDENGVPVLPGQENNNQVASLQPPANAQPVTRQAMVGAWTVSTAGSNCQIFLALTKWSGGYRAASRGCSAPAISDVQAWDVKDKQVAPMTRSRKMLFPTILPRSGGPL